MAQAPKDHEPLIEEDFRGIFSRGTDDNVPNGFQIEAVNVKFDKGTVRTRDGSELSHPSTNIVRFYEYRRINETPRYIYLDSAGNLFDSLFTGNPIYTDPAFVDFSMTVMFNRAYITPHNRIEGLPGKHVLVYTGTGLARPAAGVAPTGFSLIAIESGLSGFCEIGIHLFAVAYVTDTDFITAPGIETGIAECTITLGDKQVAISQIPIGGGHIRKRVILATKSIPPDLYTGNKLGYEFFFVPGGTIENNVDTTKLISFYDADLMESADYLFDNLGLIPAGLAIFPYNSRMIVLNADGQNWTGAASEPLKPETFNGIDGYFTVDPNESISGLRNGFEFRKNLIITASDRFYATVDNGNSPSTWEITLIDRSLGSECFTVATILDARGTGNDRAWVGTRAGLISYEGFVKKPELSANVEGLWKRINKAKFNLVQVVDEPIYHRVIISVPLDDNNIISHLLVGDYREAFTVYNTIDETQIKWSLWQLPAAPTSIIGARDIINGKPTIAYSIPAGIYLIKDGLPNDSGTAIDNWVKMSLKTSMAGWICHYGGMKLRIKGNGTLLTTLHGEDDYSDGKAVPNIDLLAAPKKEIEMPFNFKNEKCSIKLRVVGFSSYFILNKLELYAKPLWASRP